jgi:hypothetical protein
MDVGLIRMHRSDGFDMGGRNDSKKPFPKSPAFLLLSSIVGRPWHFPKTHQKGGRLLAVESREIHGIEAPRESKSASTRRIKPYRKLVVLWFRVRESRNKSHRIINPEAAYLSIRSCRLKASSYPQVISLD